jgi:hypothetical protein
MPVNWRILSTVFPLGASIVVIGYSILIYVNSVIDGLRAQLLEAGLTTAQISTLQGTLDAWQIQRITMLQPFSYILILAGFLIILYSVVYTVLAISDEHLTQKQEKLENALINEKPIERNRNVHKTSFPVAGGILTIIAAGIIIFYAIYYTSSIAAIVINSNSYYYQEDLTYLVFVILAGVWSFLAFGLGLAAGILSLKRKHFALSSVGISSLLVGGLFSILGIGLSGRGWSFGVIVGLPIIILAILSMIFVGVSKNEFT